MQMSKSKDCIVSGMDVSVADTLDAISSLVSPVVRSCHVGNNTSNIWGWLAIGLNTKLVQYDHTLYGVDENCMPWLVLGDRGRILACFDHRGKPRRSAIGQHVNLHMQQIDPKYRSHLNYAIHADYNQQDLMLYHMGIVQELSRNLNNSKPSFDSKELLSIPEVIESVLQYAVKKRALDLIFDRWIRRRGKKRYLTVQKIREIEYPQPDGVRITEANGIEVFSGNAQDLKMQMFTALDAICKRLTEGTAVTDISYPWLTVSFSYMAAALKEYSMDPDQRHFWHAGGSSSQYYINDKDVKKNFRRLRDLLAAAGSIPQNATITMIPTYSCQLFATNPNSLVRLAEMIECWRRFLQGNEVTMQKHLRRLATVSHPFEAIEDAYPEVPKRTLETLLHLLARFNAEDLNVLPVAHAAYIGHATYNKFGVAQHQLLNVQPIFPINFANMKWVELELLTKILAHAKFDNPE
jgi:hypothetical protein